MEEKNRKHPCVDFADDYNLHTCWRKMIALPK